MRFYSETFGLGLCWVRKIGEDWLTGEIGVGWAYCPKRLCPFEKAWFVVRSSYRGGLGCWVF